MFSKYNELKPRMEFCSKKANLLIPAMLSKFSWPLRNIRGIIIAIVSLGCRMINLNLIFQLKNDQKYDVFLLIKIYFVNKQIRFLMQLEVNHLFLIDI